jgi:hypothetical protein
MAHSALSPNPFTKTQQNVYARTPHTTRRCLYCAYIRSQHTTRLAPKIAKHDQREKWDCDCGVGRGEGVDVSCPPTIKII